MKKLSVISYQLSVKRAFTLIELLVVITVIGLLSTMVLVGLSGVRAQGRDTRRVADLRNTQNALEIFFNANNSYPTSASWQGLENDLINADIGVKRIPRDPLSPRYEYEYAVDSSDLLHYVLKATLESADNSALREDSDGSVYNLDCGSPSDDRFYCIEL